LIAGAVTAPWSGPRYSPCCSPSPLPLWPSVDTFLSWHVALLSVCRHHQCLDTPAAKPSSLKWSKTAPFSPTPSPSTPPWSMQRAFSALPPEVSSSPVSVRPGASHDGISYCAVIVSLLLMTVAATPPRRRDEENLWRELAEGFSYVSGSVPIRAILLLRRHRQPCRHALLSSAAHFRSRDIPRRCPYPRTPNGIHRVGHSSPLLPWLPAAPSSDSDAASDIAALLFGCGIFVFALSHNLALSVVMLLVTGFHDAAHGSSNTILQTISNPQCVAAS